MNARRNWSARAFLGLLVLLQLFGVAHAAAAQDPVGTLGANVEGALGSFRAAAGWETTNVNVQLGAGETRQLRVPLLARAQSMELSTAELEDGSDRVKWTEPAIVWPSAWNALPFSLQGRSLSPLESSVPRVGGIHWAWLATCLLLVATLRQRPRRAFVLGVLLSGTLFLLPEPPPTVAPLVTVYEGDATSGRWLEVRGAEDRLVVEGIHEGWLRRLPTLSKGRLELDHANPERWAARFEGARIYFMRETDSHPRPGPAGPGQRAWSQTWQRSPGAGWSSHGAWAVDQGLPNAIPDGPGPPGWLIAGLPQGVGILIGELAGDPAESQEAAWVRLVGYEGAPRELSPGEADAGE